MNKQEWRLYHGKVIWVAQSSSHPFKSSIHIADQTSPSWAISTKAYDIFDFMLTPVVDINWKYVVVRENTKSKLARLMLDDTKEEVPSKKTDWDPKLLYKFDPHLLHDFYSVDMKVVDKIFYEHQQATLLEPQNQEIVREILQWFPMYVQDHFFLHELLRNYKFYLEDSERIHLAAFAHELAKHFVKYENWINDTEYIQELYDRYLLYVVDRNKAVDKKIFKSYAYDLANEIRNKKTSNKTLFEKSLLNRYDQLSPMIKYMMVPNQPEYRYTKEDYSYITCLYFIQDIWTKYSSMPKFNEQLDILLQAAEKSYLKGIAPNTYPDKDEQAHIPDRDLHRPFIFSMKDGVHKILESCFVSVCDRLQAEDKRWVYTNKLFANVVWKTLESKLWNSRDKLQWFFYCVYLLNCIRQKVVANKQ